MKCLQLVSLLLFSALFIGCCPTITRSPPTAAFMDSYDRDDATIMAGGSFYMGDLVNDSNSAGYSSSDGGTKYRE